MTAPQPGDFAVVTAGGLPGRIVRWLERLYCKIKKIPLEYADYQHAFIYIGDGEIIQAEPGGTRYGKLTPHAKTIWSSGVIDPTPEQRDLICDAARKYASARNGRGVGYSFIDYLAVVVATLHIRFPFLKWYVQWSGRMICSQEVDKCEQDAGMQLYDDHRWNGEVVPADLAWMLVKRGAVPVEGT